MTTNSYVMMALGPYRFSLSTAAFQDLERTSAWRWPSVDRVGARPALQFVGPGEDRVSMRGTIYPHFRGGIDQVTRMREAAAMGTPHRLVDGTGRDWGKYVITEVRETQTVFFSNGTPRKIDFDISMSMYGEDSAAGAISAGVAGFVQAMPKVNAPVDVIATLSEGASKDDWLKKVSSSSLLSSLDTRRLMTMTSDGMATFRDAVQTGYSAIRGVNRTITEIDGYRRAATALVRSIEYMFSADGARSLAHFQMSLANIIAVSNAIPFNDLLDALAERKAQEGGENILEVVTPTADAAALFGALIEARAND